MSDIDTANETGERARRKLGAPSVPSRRLVMLTTSYPRFPEDPAGAFVAEMGDALVACGYAVRVAAMPAPPGGVLSALRRGRVLGTARDLLAFWRRIVGPADLVVAHWLVPSALFGLRLGVPVVGVAHGGDVRLLAAAPARLRKVLISRLGGVIAVSDAAARILGAERTLVTPMGLRDRDFVGFPAACHQRAEGAPLRVLFLGRDVPIKGLDVLLQAVQGLPGVELTIAGTTRAGGLGPVSPVDRPGLLKRHDLLCVPSVGAEGMPRVALESWAAGRPVLASAVGGLVDWVPSGDQVPAGDVQALRAALETRRDRRARGEPVGRLVDVEGLRWSRLGPRIAGFLEEILAAASR